jgi:hypothetical protein
MTKFYNKILEILGSNKFYYAALTLFIFEAAWIALTARYPMAFDEAFHFGIIQIYSHQLSPFFAHQPPNSDQFGALTRDPSYLYHYLMSFPYRLSADFIKNTNTNIIILRIIDIGFFAGAIVVFKKAFTKYLKVSNSLVNAALLFFVLTPLVPLLAAQINYDNLLILLTAVSLYLVLGFVDDFKNKNIFNIKSLALLLSVCMLASLVQYAYLPILVTIFIYITIIVFKDFRKNKHVLVTKIKDNYKKLSKPILIGIGVLLLISTGLFLERDGYNTIKYHTPIPDCSAVLSVNACKAYSPWDRNYVFEMSKSNDINYNAINFTGQWIHLYFFYSLFYALNGSASGYAVGGPLPLTQVVGVGVFFAGIILFIIYRRRIFKSNNLLFLMFCIIVIYVMSIWVQNYSDFLTTGVAVAEQGRYLIILLLPGYVMVALGFRQLLLHHKNYKSGLTVVILLLFLQGGGVTTYMITSDSTWYWEDSYAVAKVSHDAKKVLTHVIVHKKTTSP